MTDVSDDPVPTCSICGDRAHGNHFGALSCKCCAAFFRRAVTARSRFECRRGGACPVRKSGKKVCSSCRYQRCLQVGMQESNVMCVLQVQAGTTSTSVSDYDFRSKVVIRRCQILRKLDKPHQVTSRNASRANLVNGFAVELQVLQDHCADLIGESCALLHTDVTPVTLAQQLIVEWSLYQISLETLRDSGLDSRRMCLPDLSYVELSSAGLMRFYGCDLRIRDLPMVVRFAIEHYSTFLQFIGLLDSASLDGVEQAILWKLIYAQTHQHLFETRQSQRIFVDRSLRELHGHYQSTYRDYVGRLDTLLQLSGHFRMVKRAIDEIAVFIELHSSDRPTLLQLSRKLVARKIGC